MEHSLKQISSMIIASITEHPYNATYPVMEEMLPSAESEPSRFQQTMSSSEG